MKRGNAVRAAGVALVSMFYLHLRHVAGGAVITPTPIDTKRNWARGPRGPIGTNTRLLP
jgi:hypothetical protein